MLGDGKVAAVTSKTSPEDILTIFYGIMDTNRYTTLKRVNDLFAKSSTGQRRVMAKHEIEEGIENNEDIADSLGEGMTEAYVKKAFQVISAFTDPFKRKCTAAMFMASGTTLKYPDSSKLRIDTSDPIVNAENEEINNLIRDFGNKLYIDYEEAVLNFQAYMENNFPQEVRDEFVAKSGDYFTQSDVTGNIKRALVKAHKNIGITFTNEDYDKFKVYLFEYRALTNALDKPGEDRVSSFLGIDKKVMRQKGGDGLKPIIGIMPDKLVKSLVNGE